MRVLITGGTGLVGRGLVATAASQDRLTILHRRDYACGLSGVEEVVADVRDRKAIMELLEVHQYDAIIHTAGLASVDYIEQNAQEGWESNVLGTQHIAETARKQDIPLVYISSNAVFDGKKAPYAEHDAVRPVNQYGRIKVECEMLVRRVYGEAAIVRPILMYGWHRVEGRANPVTWLLERLKKGESTPLVTDVRENPLWSHECAEAIWRVLRLGKTGIFHIAGRDVVNRYELGQLTAEVFGLDASLLRPVDSSYFPAIAPRPPDTSFVTERMERDLGLDPLSLKDGLRQMRALSRSDSSPLSPKAS